jgi:hypothetical protein
METYSSVSNDYKMFDNKMDFKESPKSTPSLQEMLKHMFIILMEYEKSMDDKQDAAINPMNGRVTMQLRDGTIFEIPENIQRIAIVKYLEMKNNPNLQKALEPEIDTIASKPQPQIQVEKQKCAKRKSTLKKIVYAILIIAILFALYKYFNNNDDEVYSGINF